MEKKKVSIKDLEEASGGSSLTSGNTTYMYCLACHYHTDWSGDYRNYIGDCPNPKCGAKDKFVGTTYTPF